MLTIKNRQLQWIKKNFHSQLETDIMLPDIDFGFNRIPFYKTLESGVCCNSIEFTQYNQDGAELSIFKSTRTT